VSKWRLQKAIDPVIGVFVAGPVAVNTLVQPPAGPVYTVTPERIVASAAVVAGLVGACVGGFALIRSVRRIGDGRRGAMVALAVCPISVITGTLVVVTADGGVGTGNGVAGAVVAVTVGLIGMVLGGIALTRSRLAR
jgi:hypothetical protein